MKLLLDTNVLVDFYAQRDPFSADANKIAVAGMFGDAELWACPHSFPDILFILRRAVPAARLQEAMRASMEFINVCTVNQEDVAAALELGWADGEDALVNRCAERVKADYLVTRDAAGFRGARVSVVSPSQWLAMMERERGIVYDEVAF